MNISGWWFRLFTNIFVKNILMWHHRIYSLSFLFEHDKVTSEICPSYDLSVMIFSWPLAINCTIYVLYLFCGFSCSYAVKSDLDCIVAHVTLIKCLLILPDLVFLSHFMPIWIFVNLTLKYWRLHTNILLIFNLAPFIVVIITLVQLDQLYLAVTPFVFVQQFLIFVCIVANVTHKFWLFMN